MEYRLLDLSAHQGQVEYQKVKKDGIWGVMLKCTEGDSYLSSAFQENYEAAKKAGLHVGAYHFLRAETPAQAEAEADYFISRVAGKELDLPLAVDIEAAEQASISDLSPIALAFCKKLEKAGYYAMIYSMVSWFKSKLTAPSLDMYDRWVAHVKPGLKKPAFDGQYGIWQFTWSARVDGIVSNVDENKCYLDYPAIIRKAGLNHLKPEQAEKDQPSKENQPSQENKPKRIVKPKKLKEKPKGTVILSNKNKKK